MDKILTVVIPSYNVEKFLNQTLDSFICDEDTMKKFEVIVVDDGSKDNTAKIGKEYADKYPDTFRVISKENGGHGSTINCGIRNAVGKYFKVVDGDDWVNTPDFVKLVEDLEKTESEYVFTNYYEYYDDVNRQKAVDFPQFKDGTEYDFADVANKVYIPMHALMIKTSVLKDNNIVIDEKCFYVDVEYVMFPVPFVNKVTFLDLHVYMYRLALSTQSVSILGFQKHINDHLRVTFHMFDFYRDYISSDKADSAKADYMRTCIADLIITQGAIYSSYPDSDMENRKRFMEFDRKAKELSPEIYELSSVKSGKLRMLRKYNFKHYRLIQSLSRLHFKMTNK